MLSGLLSPLALRTLRALRSGPLYHPTLDLILDHPPAGALRSCLTSLRAAGLVAPAHELGPNTWRITDAGLERVAAASTGGPGARP